jgi:hypothetical protein
VLGPDHVDTLTTMNNLASHQDLGEYQKAEPPSKDVVEKQKQLLGDQDPEIIQSIQRLSNLHHQLHDSKFQKIQNSCKNINLQHQNVTLTIVFSC